MKILFTVYYFGADGEDDTPAWKQWISISNLAEYAGISVTQAWRIARGKREPTENMLRRIEQALEENGLKLKEMRYCKEAHFLLLTAID